MRQWLLMSWVWLATGVMAGLITLTLPAKPVIATLPPPATASAAKPGCQWGIIKDVNNCGSWTVISCTLLKKAPGGPGTPDGQQCEICRIWQFQIQGIQRVEKRWYDCDGDNQADCQIWWGWAQLKGCRRGSSTASVNPLAAEDVECMCEQ
ncbi:MAG: hypothetical protein OXFUSZZB_000451 [Candidatus Fervidibacter sp.]|jgi:hypothetical protein